MAVLQKIRQFFTAQEEIEPERLCLRRRPLMRFARCRIKYIQEVLKLNLRCFREAKITRNTRSLIC
jgi:hypothetical protein